jgi:hypothetical protein
LKPPISMLGPSGHNRLDNYIALHRKENRREGSRIARIRAAMEKRQRGRGHDQ